MSIKPDKISKKSFHRRNDSGELDVFEAASYFSGATEVFSGCYINGSTPTFAQKVMIRDQEKQGWRDHQYGRSSLDMPNMRNSIPSQTHVVMEKQMKEKKYKQPSSPGGRLASFLNSLFNQTHNSKKKKSKSTTQSLKDELDESPSGRRKRRSSISHFTSDSKSFYSSSSSGFRTPPPSAHTKNYKDLRSYSDHKQTVVPLPKYNSIGHFKPNTVLQKDEKFKFNNGFQDQKLKINSGNGFVEKDRIRVDKYQTEEREFSKLNIEVGVDDGGESDSSSDLFELENYDLSYYSSGLPVYETTHLDSINRGGAPISNGAR